MTINEHEELKMATKDNEVTWSEKRTTKKSYLDLDPKWQTVLAMRSPLCKVAQNLPQQLLNLNAQINLLSKPSSLVEDEEKPIPGGPITQITAFIDQVAPSKVGEASKLSNRLQEDLTNFSVQCQKNISEGLKKLEDKYQNLLRDEKMLPDQAIRIIAEQARHLIIEQHKFWKKYANDVLTQYQTDIKGLLPDTAPDKNKKEIDDKCDLIKSTINQYTTQLQQAVLDQTSAAERLNQFLHTKDSPLANKEYSQTLLKDFEAELKEEEERLKKQAEFGKKTDSFTTLKSVDDLLNKLSEWGPTHQPERLVNVGNPGRFMRGGEVIVEDDNSWKMNVNTANTRKALYVIPDETAHHLVVIRGLREIRFSKIDNDPTGAKHLQQIRMYAWIKAWNATHPGQEVKVSIPAYHPDQKLRVHGDYYPVWMMRNPLGGLFGGTIVAKDYLERCQKDIESKFKAEEGKKEIAQKIAGLPTDQQREKLSKVQESIQDVKMKERQFDDECRKGNQEPVKSIIETTKKNCCTDEYDPLAKSIKDSPLAGTHTVKRQLDKIEQQIDQQIKILESMGNLQTAQTEFCKNYLDKKEPLTQNDKDSVYKQLTPEQLNEQARQQEKQLATAKEWVEELNSLLTDLSEQVEKLQEDTDKLVDNSPKIKMLTDKIDSLTDKIETLDKDIKEKQKMLDMNGDVYKNISEYEHSKLEEGQEGSLGGPSYKNR